ncbi:hypothetical protein LHP98_10610 [Rhodobacter sp. Har01]|uniref:hypothetical protein n=1 Tax=Rhodobacter sp. Har01 TaxID=2883999 RepID=UPI001D078BCD|nr:hypothetical protein [Rhodobacter sp. Har01]MCB6178582.1 hypothetical protein [Rhodobacter sp. Har01]
MADFVNPALFNAHALPAAIDEPHAQPGNHVRVSHHPFLGLPVAPFILQRAVPRSRKDVQYRTEATFAGPAGLLALPVAVTRQQPVTISLGGPGATCIWVHLIVRRERGQVPDLQPQPDPRPPIAVPGDIRPLPVIAPPRAIRPEIDPARLRLAPAGGGLAGIASRALAGDGLAVEAYMASLTQGPAFVGRRSADPYILSAPGIRELHVTGEGVIEGILWIAGEDPQKLAWQTISALNLPTEGGPRYMSISEPRKLAANRVDRQAPKRRPLQDTTDAPAPAAAPGFSEPEERDRVESLFKPLDGDLARLINDADPQLLQTVIETVTDAAGVPLASGPGQTSTFQTPRLIRVLQAQADAGTATYLGYKDRDKDFVEVEDRMVFYRVLGYFRDQPMPPAEDPASQAAQAGYRVAIAGVPLDERTATAESVRREVQERIEGLLRAQGHEIHGKFLDEGRDYMALSTLAVADRLAPLDPPDMPGAGPASHLQWLPALPPAAVREVGVAVAGVRVAATLAFGRRQPAPAGSYRPLNPSADNGWRVPLALGVQVADGTSPPDDTPGRGTLFDRRAAADTARYFVAQCDRFGRWSPFAATDAAAGLRPRPPRPTIRATYSQPAAAQAALQGGQIDALIPLPEAAALAPGSFLLARVRVHASHIADGAVPGAPIALPVMVASVGTAVAIPPPGPGAPSPGRAVPVRFQGPILQPMELRRMLLSAEWEDTGGQLSVRSEVVRLRMADPRAPVPVPIPETLLYSSRPDATGLAWVERSWAQPAGSPIGWAVYYTDETRLLAHLVATGDTATADALRANANRAARAGTYRARQGEFPDYLYERLDGVVVETAPGMLGFRHAVSGSSRVLNGYKIVPESAVSGARPDLSAADLVLYGVPNSDPPPRPSVKVRIVPPEAGEPALVAEVTVTLPAGVTAGQTARLYRSRAGRVDPLAAPVVATLPFGTADPATGAQVAVFRDIGAAQVKPSARLAAFVNHTWFADAQGAPESGSSMAGLWSRVSDPVTVAVIPPDPPAALAFDRWDGTAVAGGRTDAVLVATHPDPLAPPALGPYRVRLDRALPGQPMRIVAEMAIGGIPVLLAAVDDAPGFVTPVGTRFRATLIDPVGRTAPPLDITLT